MQAIDQPFAKIINGATQFVIPVFQRDYSWTEAQCERLWSDVLQIARDRPGRGHFLGSVVYVSTRDSAASFTRWLLIDGQQRLTTLTLLLAALRDHVRETGWVGDKDGPMPKRIENYFLRNNDEEGDRRFKLVLRRRDRQTLEAIIEGQQLPATRSERLCDNYDFFREQLIAADPAEIYRGINRLILVDVKLDEGSDDPQLIFESLNSTGVDLSQSDLVRNFVLMRLPEREQTRLYETFWAKIEAAFSGSESVVDSFLRDYIALKTKASKQARADEIHQEFRRVFPGLMQYAGTLESLLAEMLRFARHYAAFRIGAASDPPLAGALSRLRRLVEVPAILVMRLFEAHETVGSLTLEDFKIALRVIESYVFRRAICGEQTRGYWQVFASLAYRLDMQKPLESLKANLALQRESYRYPNDDDFRRELVTRDIYGLDVCGYLLERLENFETREPTNVADLTIEHIMPQNLRPEWQAMLGINWMAVHERWLHRLGNLTLTGYNSSYSDRPFDEKQTIRGGFTESAVRLNKFVREQSRWTENEIEQRTLALADRALLIWPALQVSGEAIGAAREAELRDLAERRDIQKVHMTDAARSLFELLSPRVRGLDPRVIELAEGKSVSYHCPSFFLEVLPRKHRLMLLLPVDLRELNDDAGLIEDATQYKFFVYAKYEGKALIRVEDPSDIDTALPLLRQAFNLIAST